jgi:hypothetical protein
VLYLQLALNLAALPYAAVHHCQDLLEVGFPAAQTLVLCPKTLVLLPQLPHLLSELGYQFDVVSALVFALLGVDLLHRSGLSLLLQLSHSTSGICQLVLQIVDP